MANLELDVDQFKSDMQREDIVTKVQKAREEAQEIGVPGTPLILINGQIYGGPRDYASLNGIVDDDDVTIVSAAYNPSGTEPRWAYGNFDFDDGVDDDDVTLLGAYYDPLAQPLTPPTPLAAAGNQEAHAAVFADLGDTRRAGRRQPPDYVVSTNGALSISAAELVAIADEIFAQDGSTRKKSILAT